MIHVLEKGRDQQRSYAGSGDADVGPMDQLIDIRDIAEQFQLTSYTVNYYTNIGLLRVVVKQKNRRLYDRHETAERMEKILNFSKNGYPLLLIKKLINDPNGELKRGAAA